MPAVVDTAVVTSPAGPSTSATTRWLAVAVSAGGTARASSIGVVVVVPVGERGHGGEAGGDRVGAGVSGITTVIPADVAGKNVPTVVGATSVPR